MAKSYVTNGDRILQAVLSDEHLMKFGDYNPYEYEKLDAALTSDNVVVRTVAQIISSVGTGSSSKEIYTIVMNYLIKNV